MLSPPDNSFASISEISSRLRDRRVSAVALTEKILQRISVLNPSLNAFRFYCEV